MDRVLKKENLLLKVLGECSYKINFVAEKICVICGITMFICLNIGVFTRFVLNSPVIWSEEVARFLMIWIAFVGSSVAFKKKGLVNFEFFLRILPKKVYSFVMLFIQCSILFFLVWFLIIGQQSIGIFIKSIASATQISLFWPALGLIIGGVFMLFHSVYFIVEHLLNFDIIEMEGHN